MGLRLGLTKRTGRNVLGAMVGLNGPFDVLPVAPQRHQVPSLLGRVILGLEIVDVLRSVIVEVPIVVTDGSPAVSRGGDCTKGTCWI